MSEILQKKEGLYIIFLKNMFQIGIYTFLHEMSDLYFSNAVRASSVNRYSFPVYLGEKWKRVYCLILALPANLPA